MYKKYSDYLTNGLHEGEVLLLSLQESIDYKAEIKGLPVCITKDGSEPPEASDEVTD
jgi:hypothetical protein